MGQVSVGYRVQHLVVTVDHDGNSNGAGSEPPRVLPHEGLAALLGLELDAEHLAEVLTQAVTAPRHATSSNCGRGYQKTLQDVLIWSIMANKKWRVSCCAQT